MTAAELTGAGLVREWLLTRGLTTVFFVPGAMVFPLLRELSHEPRIRLVPAAHELGAAFMADGMASAGSAPAVCLATGGPGASNMLTAAVAARLQGTPVLFLTGRLPAELEGRGAFQDTGARGTRDGKLFAFAAGFSREATRTAELLPSLDAAWEELRLGRPAHVSLSVAALSASAPPEGETRVRERRDGARAASPPPGDILRSLETAKRPLILAGWRLASPRGAAALRLLAESRGIPVVTTLAAKGLLPEDHELSLGNCGFAGTRRANQALFDPEIDLLLLLGADLNERDSGGWDPRLFEPRRRLVRLDSLAPAYEPTVRPATEHVSEDLPDRVGELADSGRASEAERREWIARLRAVEGSCPLDAPAGAGMLPMTSLLSVLRRTLPDESVLVVDGGTCRVFAGQCWEARSPLAFFSACATAPTGWAVAAAVGCRLARPSSTPVVALVGDAAMAMHGLELATAARLRLPLVVIVADNGGHGALMRRAREEERLLRLVAGFPVDWASFARSVGATGTTVRSASDLTEAITGALRADGPSLLHVAVTRDEAMPFPEYVSLAYGRFLDGDGGPE